MTTRRLLAMFFIALFLCASALGQTPAFSYQGKLDTSGSPANGNFDFEFRLFDAVGGGAQVGQLQTRTNVAVADGIFTVTLDFGAAALPGADRFLDISVRATGGGAFTTLTPRQRIASAPYAVKTLNADNATNATNAVNAQNATNATTANTANTAATAGNFTGALAGDVTGLQGATTVARIQGRNVAATAPTAGQVLKYNGATNQWTPDIDNGGAGGGGTITGVTAGTGLTGGGITGNVTLNIANGGVGTNQLADNGVTDAKINGVNGAKVTGTVANATNAANAATAATATNALSLGGVAANQYLQTNGNGSGLTNLNAGSITAGTLATARGGTGLGAAGVAGNYLRSNGANWASSALQAADIPVGSGNYIQNTAAPQAGNFNISGTGTAGGTLSANIVNATTQYRLGDNRVLSIAGTENTFVGVSAGFFNSGTNNAFFGNSAGGANTGGSFNAFFGQGAGQANTTGSRNSFFGLQTGFSNTTASDNSFFGYLAGQSNTTGILNAFFGASAGAVNQSGQSNSFFGRSAGNSNTTGSANAVFGKSAALNNTTGSGNAFFGAEAGLSNTTGDSNAFFGFGAGNSNTVGSDNTIIGFFAGVTANNLTNATAIGADAKVGASNSLVLGSINGVGLATADTSVGIGTTVPAARLHVKGASSVETTPIAILESTGTQIPLAFKIGATEYGRIRANTLGELTLAAFNGTANNIRLRAGDDAGTDLFVEGATGWVGIGTGANSPLDRLHVGGNIRVGTGVDGCVKDANATVIAGVCSSDLRFKKNVAAFGSVLEGFAKLRPVSFDWRAEEFADRHFGTRRSFGLIAQEVEQAFPDLVVTDEQGFRAVNYSKLPLLTIQAIKEQQAQIESQKRTNDAQQTQIESQQKIIETLEQRLAQLEKKQQRRKR